MKIEFPIPDLPCYAYEVPRRIAGRYDALERLEAAISLREVCDDPLPIARAVSRINATLRRVAEVDETYPPEPYVQRSRWSGSWSYCHECACDGRGTHGCLQERRAKHPCERAERLFAEFLALGVLMEINAPSCNVGDAAYVRDLRTEQAAVYDELAYHTRRAAWA